MAYVKLGVSSSKFGNNTRLFGLPTGSKKGFTALGNQLIAQPIGGSPSILVSSVIYGDFDMHYQCSFPVSGNVGGIVIWQDSVGSGNYYLITFSSGSSVMKLYKVVSGTRTLLDTCYSFYIPTNQFFKVGCHFESGFLSVMINSQIVMSFYDVTYTSGYIGFYAENTMIIQNFAFAALFQRVASFSVNSNDNMQDPLTDSLSIQASYAHMNYNNVLVISIPNSSDPSVYTYNGQITQNDNTIDDMDEINVVIVYGIQNTVGIAYNQTSINNHQMKARTVVITDQTLSTNAQCTERAQREITINKRYAVQPALQTPVNVGVEQFDVVTVHDSISGINTTYRVMNITTNVDAESATYNQTLDFASP